MTYLDIFNHIAMYVGYLALFAFSLWILAITLLGGFVHNEDKPPEGLALIFKQREDAQREAELVEFYNFEKVLEQAAAVELVDLCPNTRYVNQLLLRQAETDFEELPDPADHVRPEYNTMTHRHDLVGYDLAKERVSKHQYKNRWILDNLKARMRELDKRMLQDLVDKQARLK